MFQLFLGIVGVMKAAGMLRHPLSRIAGLVEALGAVMQFPIFLASRDRYERVEDKTDDC